MDLERAGAPTTTGTAGCLAPQVDAALDDVDVRVIVWCAERVVVVVIVIIFRGDVSQCLGQVELVAVVGASAGVCKAEWGLTNKERFLLVKAR